MPHLLIVFVALAVLFRFATVAISIRNEKRLKAAGAVEYHTATSILLAFSHAGYYIAAILEGVWRDAPVSAVSIGGMVLYGLSMVAFIWVVRTLGRFWTVKIIIARDHELVTNRFFNMIRHPNYYLNIIPELIGLALALSAYWTLIAGLPVYLVVLFRRIRQEEGVMRGQFESYG